MSKYIVEHGSFVNGTSLKGYLTASYDDLVRAFGPPTYDEPSGDDKVNIEWVLNIEDTELEEDYTVTIYNWKDYDGGLAATTNPSYQWHIGGHKGIAPAIALEVFQEKMKEVV